MYIQKKHIHSFLACIDDDVYSHPFMYLPAQVVNSKKIASLSMNVKITKGIKGDLKIKA
jgi:hypothetical protein